MRIILFAKEEVVSFEIAQTNFYYFLNNSSTYRSNILLLHLDLPLKKNEFLEAYLTYISNHINQLGKKAIQQITILQRISIFSFNQIGNINKNKFQKFCIYII